MDRTDEGNRIKRSVHLPDEVWAAARLGAALLSNKRGEYVSTSQWIDEAIQEKAKREGKR